jgi:hypothetical protein
MNKLLFLLLFLSSNAFAQVARLPSSMDAGYLCYDIHVDFSKNGMWAWYVCDPYGNVPIGTPRKITWIAAPYPVRMDLIGSRLETIKNNADQLAAANKAWARYVTLGPDDPSLAAVKADMIKAGVPIKP